MKKLNLTLLFVLIGVSIIAQTPQAFKYQVVVRDNSGNVLSNQSVSFRISIRTGSPAGTVVYRETHLSTTNQFGLANLDIGEGTPVTGTFSLINWSTDSKYLETELDPAGGSSYVLLGTSQMISVPYALYSENTANIDDADADPNNELQTISKVGNMVTLSDGGGSFIDDVDDADANPANELQNLSIAGNDLSISGGNTVVLPSELPLGTTGQTMRHNGTSWQSTGNLINDGTNVGIGAIPATSAILDVNSSSKGMLVPRLNSVQRTSIAAPAYGLLLYDTDTQTFWYFQNPTWIELIGTGNNSGLSDTDNDTKVQVEEITDEDKIRFDIAGTEFFVMDNGRLEVMNTGRSVFMGIRAGANDDLSENHNNFIGYYAGEANISGENNTANGYYSLRFNSSGNFNTAYGAGSLQNNIGGFNNTALGAFTLSTNTFGYYNTATGYSALYNNNGNGNTASGFHSLKGNTTGEYNTATGYYSLSTNSTGRNNTAFGKEALFSNTTGHSNVAMGVGSLFANTERANLVAIGDSALFNNGTGAISIWESKSNTAVGSKSLFSNTTGYINTAIGFHALYSNTSGAYNTAIGEQTLYSNTNGDYNTANGNWTLFSNIGGSFNVAVGSRALEKHKIGDGNSALGYAALWSDTTGINNTAIGYSAMSLNKSGKRNTAMGANSLENNTSGNANVAIGTSSLYSNTDRSNLVAIGDSALYNNGIGAIGDLDGIGNTAVGSKALLYNNTGSFNTSTGFETLYDNTSGYWNTANGFVTLRHNTIGHDNTAIGSYALSSNISGVGNTANGFHALSDNTIGYYNTSTGTNALTFNTIGSYNTAIGFVALFQNKTGSNNTAIGANALSADTSGHSNVAIGVSSLNNTSNGSNLVAIGDSALYYNGWGDFYFEAVKNTAVGSKTLYSNKTGGSNTALGFHAGFNTDSGDNNTYIGVSSGLSNINGSGNVFIGHEAGMNETGSNKLIIANSSGSEIIYGDFSSGNVGLGVIPPTEKLQVAGTIHSTINGFKFPDGSLQTSAATTFSLPYDGTTSGNPAFSITNTTGSIAIRGLATDISFGTNYGGYFEAYRTHGRGVAGVTNGIEGWGVMGEAQGTNGIGVRAIASGANGTGLYSEGNAWAGYFIGNLYTSENVGIGTTSPVGKLDVNSNLRYSGHFMSDSTSFLTHAIHAEYTGGTADASAVFGISVPSDYYGYGGYFEGGYMGVRGDVYPSGSNIYIGVSGTVDGGSGINYAVYGFASGAGTNYAGYFVGDVTVTGTFVNPSDEKIKKNIQPFTNALSKVNQLNVHTFEFKTTKDAENLNLPNGSQIGFVAQEMEVVFPHLVSEQVHTIDKNKDNKSSQKDLQQFNYKGINYIGMIPVLTQAIKEQQGIIDDQQLQIDELMKMVLELTEK